MRFLLTSSATPSYISCHTPAAQGEENHEVEPPVAIKPQNIEAYSETLSADAEDGTVPQDSEPPSGDKTEHSLSLAAPLSNGSELDLSSGELATLAAQVRPMTVTQHSCTLLTLILDNFVVNL